MERAEVSELYYIVPRTNIPSILAMGILSNARAARVAHESVAMAVIQGRRDPIHIPGGRPLHEYVNLYICARNPMMFKLINDRGSSPLAVLCIDDDVLELPHVVIADGNASSDYTRFGPSPAGLARINRERVHGNWGGHADDRVKWEHKRVKCAEVLVPDLVPAACITRILVATRAGTAALSPVAGGRPVVAAPDVFFRVAT